MSEDKEMSFLGHIGELRGHLIRSVIAIIIGALVIGFNINWVMDNILFGPTKPDFPTFRFINEFSKEFFGEEPVSLPEKFPIQVRKLYEQFNVMMSVSVFGGIMIAFPYLIWELWRFISPALHPKERKNSILVINGTWVLFVLGALCGYYIILPFAINFGYFFKIADTIQVNYDLSDYMTLFLQIIFGMALVFLFPMLVYLLTSLGILTPLFMKTYRRHAIVVIMFAAAIITPADVMSMMAAALPLLLLYELSILMSKIVYTRIQKRAPQPDSASL